MSDPPTDGPKREEIEDLYNHRDKDPREGAMETLLEYAAPIGTYECTITQIYPRRVTFKALCEGNRYRTISLARSTLESRQITINKGSRFMMREYIMIGFTIFSPYPLEEESI